VPIDDELRAMISAQHDRVRRRWPDGTPVLFPGRRRTWPEPGRSAVPPTGEPSTAGWRTATSATSTGHRSISLPINGVTRWERS